jgi:hypothetical protein
MVTTVKLVSGRDESVTIRRHDVLCDQSWFSVRKKFVFDRSPIFTNDGKYHHNAMRSRKTEERNENN